MVKTITATGLVFNDSGQFLMVKHKKLGKWLPPGGHVNSGEYPCQAAAREVLEETGVQVEVISFAPSLNLQDKIAKELPVPFKIISVDFGGNGQYDSIDFFYLCKAISTHTTIQETEIDEIGWFSPQKAMALDTFEDVVKAIDAATKLDIFRTSVQAEATKTPCK
ncbi:MAG: NUDIX hydrolase [Defluviitaleaceae bacterium]|nr:NUDIX hydrolase [Defluviitaleaceae bacterium]